MRSLMIINYFIKVLYKFSIQDQKEDVYQHEKEEMTIYHILLHKRMDVNNYALYIQILVSGQKTDLNCRIVNMFSDIQHDN